ncbi:MAG: FlgO family outer membrane protein [Candidatus Contendobacter sp.]|nr:FlgO family outer membrane protein [Candidatus Contendobacter sp.]
MNNLGVLKRLGAIIFMGCWLIAGFPIPSAWAAGPSESKKTIAVVEFAVRGGDLDPQAGAIIADSITSAIASLGYFALKDRLSLSAIAKIAKNNPFGSIGPIDAETAMQLGKLYGIHGIVTGTVSRLGERVRVTARLIDTRTGTVLRSGEIEDRDIDAVQVKLDKLAMAVTTTPVSPSQSWRVLTVKTEPTNAMVRLLNVGQPYQAGIRLPAGAYEIEVSHPGYVTRKASVKIVENDVSLLIALEKTLYALTIDVQPPESQIHLVNMRNVRQPYLPGMKLEAGVYQLEIACPGYRTEHNTITIADADVSMVLKLEPQSNRPAVPGGPPPTQTLQPSQAAQPPAQKTPPRAPRAVAVNQRPNKPAPKGVAGTRANGPSQDAGVGNRANWPNPPAPEGGAFKQGLRKLRDDFKRAFW